MIKLILLLLLVLALVALFYGLMGKLISGSKLLWLTALPLFGQKYFCTIEKLFE